MSIFSTGLYTAALVVLNIVLSFRIIALRRQYKIGIGTGKNPQLAQAVRAQANLVEHAPLVLILIASIEISSHGHLWVHILGGSLVLARILHAWGLSNSAGTSFGRFVGTLLTFIVGLTGAVILALKASGLLS